MLKGRYCIFFISIFLNYYISLLVYKTKQDKPEQNQTEQSNKTKQNTPNNLKNINKNSNAYVLNEDYIVLAWNIFGY